MRITYRSKQRQTLFIERCGSYKVSPEAFRLQYLLGAVQLWLRCLRKAQEVLRVPLSHNIFFPATF